MSETIALILLPGLDGTGIFFQPLLAALPPHIQPVVVTYPADRPLTYQQLLPLVLAALPTDEPFIVLGESFSGPLAIMAAMTRPKNLRAVILCATFVTRPLPMLKWLVPVFARSIFFQFFPPVQRALVAMGAYPEKLGKLITQVRMAVGGGMIAFRVRDLFKVDVREQLRACTLPMLYIAGKKDRVVPAANLRQIQQIKPDIQVVTFDGAHRVLQTWPAEAAAVIAKFAASLEPAVDCVST